MSYYQLDDDIENNIQDFDSEYINGNNICYICFENKEKLKLQCNHNICKECLISWIKSKYNNKCPWCKQIITKEYLTNNLKLTTSEIRPTVGVFTNGIFYGNYNGDSDTNPELNALKILCLFIAIVVILVSTQQNN